MVLRPLLHVGLDPLLQQARAEFQGLRAIMHRLRAPGGSPWDAAQTQRLARQGVDLATAGLEAMEEAWQECKRTQARS